MESILTVLYNNLMGSKSTKEIINMLKGYKTLIFNTLVAIVGLAEITGTITLIAPASVPYVIAAIAIANVLLRFGTDTGVFKKE